MSVLLNDDCDNFTDGPWVTAGSPTIAAAHTGNGFSIPSGTANTVSYNIPSGSQSSDLTVGAWCRWSNLGAAAAPWWTFRSDSGATSHVELRTNASQFQVYRSPSQNLANSASGLLAINTWYYVEMKVHLDDTAGSFDIWLNGTSVASATNVDTRNAGTKNVFDQFRFHGVGATGTWLIDDVYIRNDLNFGLTPTVNVWNGSAFAADPVRVWNGSAFADSVAVKTWNGSAFV